MAIASRPTQSTAWATSLVNNGPANGPNRKDYTTRHSERGWLWKEKPPYEYLNQWMYNAYVNIEWAGNSIIDLNTRLVDVEESGGGGGGSGSGGKTGLETMVFSTTLSPNGNADLYHKVIATDNFILNAPAGVTGEDSAGERHFIEITQDNTGSRVMTLASNIEVGQCQIRTLSTEANAKDLLELVYTGSAWILISLLRGIG